MFLYAPASWRKVQSVLAVAAFLILVSPSISAQDDPPAQAGRLSYITGSVSIQQAGSSDWGQAYPNLPLGPGDRVVTNADGRAEIQVGQTFVRVGADADVTLIDSTPLGITFGVGQGSIHVRINGLWDGQSVYANTPNGSVTASRVGQFRVDVMPDQNAALFTPFGGSYSLLVTGAGGFAQEIGHSQALELAGTNPVVPQWLQAAVWDALDSWSNSRDQQIANAVSYQYVSPEIPGAYELDAAGDWRPNTPYGPVWFPRDVPSGWAPYHYGHWVNHAPWGWVWVEDEPWGYAPFHYGRWVNFEGRWGWVPGSPAAHPVWSPALVVFAGGIHVGGAGVSAWFPLGPGEPYRPWYHASPHYMDQVNISNMRESPRVHVQTTYVNINVVNVTYVNRTIAVSAMRQEDFAAGRSAHQAPIVVDVHLMEHPQVVEHIDVPPPAHPFAGHPPVQPVRVSAERPVLINEKGKQISAKPGAPPSEPPVRPAPPVRPLPGRTVLAQPSSAPPSAAPAKPVQPSAPVSTPAGKPAVKTATPPPVQPAAQPPIKPTAPAKPEAKPSSSPAPAASPAPKPAGAPAQPAKPPVAQAPAKPAATAPAKPAADKPEQDKKNDKGKKDEKKPGI
jgi:hypothetical protein